MRLRRVLVMFESETVAGIINFDLVKLTAAVTPATGNPAITPAPARGANVAEATALALPTTGGTEGAVIADLEFNTGITGAVSVRILPFLTCGTNCFPRMNRIRWANRNRSKSQLASQADGRS
jgi:hypothetical protein